MSGHRVWLASVPLAAPPAAGLGLCGLLVQGLCAAGALLPSCSVCCDVPVGAAWPGSPGCWCLMGWPAAVSLACCSQVMLCTGLSALVEGDGVGLGVMSSRRNGVM